MNLFIEYFGTAASVIVAISLTQKNIKRLRILNLAGSAAFAVYGFIISAWPVFGLNAFIGIINIYYLIEMKRRKNYFELLFIEHPADSAYLRRFLDFYNDDIKSFMPEFNLELTDNEKAVFVLRDVLPVSLVIYREGEAEVEILTDYAIPAYRDMKNSVFFFEKIAETFPGDKKKIFTEAGSPVHNKYLKKIGFRFSEDTSRYYYR